jgi:hypothetical protein
VHTLTGFLSWWKGLDFFKLGVTVLWLGEFWKPYIGQAVGGKLDLMVLSGGAEEWAAIQ